MSFGSFFVGAGCHVMNIGRKQRAQSDRITDTNTTSISGLQSGTIAVEGVANPSEGAIVITSPMERMIH